MADHETARHAEHDLEVVATFAAAEASDLQAEHARELIAACTECAGLARDLAAITSSVRTLPAAERAIGLEIAPRDFRITAEQAARLRGGSPVGRWLAGVSAALASFGRPVGASLAAMGIAGLLVGSVSMGAFGAPSSAGGLPESGAGQQSGATFRVTGNEQAPGATATSDRVLGPLGTAEPVEPLAGDDGAPVDAAEDGRPRWVLVGSAALLVAGTLLLLLGVRARGRVGQRS